MIVTSIIDKLAAYNITNVGFEIFEVDTALLKVAQWQPQSIIEFSDEHGFIPTNMLHEQKALLFIQYAKNSHASLVVTPEYSFPYQVLEQIIQDSSLWPDKKKLWCLGMEGISYQALTEFINRMRNASNVIIEPVTQNIRPFFNLLIYMIIAEDKLCVICQAKYQPARDIFGEYEGLNLTLGQEIVAITDQDKTKVFFSLICSDALNADIDIMNQSYRNATMLIFIPQLNPSFLHESFDFAYYRFLYHRPNVRIIIANWSSETTITANGKVLTIVHGFSSFLRRYENERHQAKLQNKNHYKGIYFGYKDHSEVWHFSNIELIMTYSILPYKYENTHIVLQENAEPSATSVQIIDSTSLVTEAHLCNIDWKWLETELNIKRDHFCKFGVTTNECSCFNNLACFIKSFFIETYHIKHGSSSDQIISPLLVLERYPSDSSYIQKAKMQREIISNILYSIDNRKMPYAFQHFKDNHQWNISNKFNNLSTKDHKQFHINSALVVYADCYDHARSFYNFVSCCSQYGDNFANKTIVYYTTADGYCYYEPKGQSTEVFSTQLSNSEVV